MKQEVSGLLQADTTCACSVHFSAKGANLTGRLCLVASNWAEKVAGWKGKLRWPTSATAKLTFSRQNILFHGKTYFSTAKLTFPRQNLLFHGKTYFSTAKLTFCTFRDGLSFLILSISLIRQSNLLEHLGSTWNCSKKQGGTFELSSLKYMFTNWRRFLPVSINAFFLTDLIA